MNTAILPGGRRTSRIGFGCATLMGGRSVRESHLLIEAALDAGIRHFDVAPVYGYGLAENIIGGFFKGQQRTDITITTKVGIERPRAPGIVSGVRSVARKYLSAAPRLRQYLGKRVYQINRRKNYELASIQASFDESQRRLSVERIDVLLLHEASPADITDELMMWLENLKRAGRIDNYGIGAARTQAFSVIAERPQLGQVIQTSWSALEEVLTLPRTSFLCTHGAIRPLPTLTKMLMSEPQRAAELSRSVGVDLLVPNILGRLLLGAALANNSAGIVLLASSNVDHVRRNAQLVEQADLIEAGRRLVSALVRCNDVVVKMI